jgi:hypothetical protein
MQRQPTFKVWSISKKVKIRGIPYSMFRKDGHERFRAYIWSSGQHQSHTVVVNDYLGGQSFLNGVAKIITYIYNKRQLFCFDCHKNYIHKLLKVPHQCSDNQPPFPSLLSGIILMKWQHKILYPAMCDFQH